MVKTETLVKLLCEAIQTLQETNGSTLNAIASVPSLIDNKAITPVSVHMALKLAVKRGILVLTRDGKYKLKRGRECCSIFHKDDDVNKISKKKVKRSGRRSRRTCRCGRHHSRGRRSRKQRRSRSKCKPSRKMRSVRRKKVSKGKRKHRKSGKRRC